MRLKIGYFQRPLSVKNDQIYKKMVTNFSIWFNHQNHNKSLMNETDALLVIWDNEQFNPFLYVTFTNELYDFDFSYWTKKCITFIITISVTQILDMKRLQLLHCYMS